MLDVYYWSGVLYTVGPLIIESPDTKYRVSTGELKALDDPFLVQTKFETNN